MQRVPHIHNSALRKYGHPNVTDRIDDTDPCRRYLHEMLRVDHRDLMLVNGLRPFMESVAVNLRYCNLLFFSSNALRATITVESDMNTAASAGCSTIPFDANTPAANGK